MGINNNRYQKNANIALVTRTIWRKPGISRVEIAQQLGLYRSTVTNIITALIEQQVVHEGSLLKGHGKGGRHAVGLQLNSHFGCIIGIDLQPSYFHLVIVDIVGTVLHSHSGTFAKGDLYKIIVGAIRSIWKVIERLRRPLHAICLAVPGVVDYVDGNIIHSLPLEVEQYPLSERLTKQFGVPVLLENDANCYAWLQLGAYRKQSLANFLCVVGVYHDKNKEYQRIDSLGLGLGVGIHGAVFRGHQGAAGEFVTNSWRGGIEGQSGLPNDVYAHMIESPSGYHLFMKDFFSSLVPVITALNPEICFVQGEPFSDREFFLAVLEQEVPQFIPALERAGCQLKIEPYNPHALAKGAAMMFLQKLYSVPELSGKPTIDYVLWDDVLATVKR